MRIIDWSSDVCSSDLSRVVGRLGAALAGRDGDFADDLGEDLAALGVGGVLASFDGGAATHGKTLVLRGEPAILLEAGAEGPGAARRATAAGRSGGSGRSPGTRPSRSEEHTSELQSLMRTSYAVFCLKKKKKKNNHITNR